MTLICCGDSLFAVANFSGLSATLDGAYDLRWQQQGVTSEPVILAFEQQHGVGYRLTLAATAVKLERVTSHAVTCLASSNISWRAGQSYALAVKRRAGAVLICRDHRFLLEAALPESVGGTLAFQRGAAFIQEARYQRIEPPLFGDDFMRVDALESMLLSANSPWMTDQSWEVDYYRRVHPALHPTDPLSGAALSNPWMLSSYPNAKTVANGFWMLYAGLGPSWSVTNEVAFPAFRDSYSARMSVRPDYHSEVGLLVAYQDSGNYLRLRWRAADDNDHANARAELLAMINNHPTILATSPRGFRPEQWYTLRLTLGWQRVQAYIDEQLLFDVANPGAVEGRVGLFASTIAHPLRPALDHDTAMMYQVTDKDGETHNEAEQPFSDGYVLFDDVQVTPCLEERPPTAMLSSPTLQRALQAGTYPQGMPTDGASQCCGRLRLRAGAAVGVSFHADNGVNYRWEITATRQQLRQLATRGAPNTLDVRQAALPTGQWLPFRMEEDGAYLACYLNDVRVLDGYAPGFHGGQWNLWSNSGRIEVDDCRVQTLPSPWRTLLCHSGFAQDKWLATWASDEADWTPAFTPGRQVTPLGGAHSEIGPAAPYATNQPGLFWHKGGHYHDLRLYMPLTASSLSGQTLYLCTRRDPQAGYKLRWEREGSSAGMVTLMRKERTIGVYHFTLGARTRAQIERRGDLLIISVQQLDPADSATEAAIVRAQVLHVFRDSSPLLTDQLGMTVTPGSCPAAALQVLSDRRQDAFELSPVDWATQNGVWKVMARYTCQPQWNWFGGFGGGLPAAWNKYRLTGDQNVEVYLGVKMQYDDRDDDEKQRFRDLNLSICAQPAQPESGYSVVRAHIEQGVSQTMLLRNGVVVQTSKKQADLLPTDGSGHREWFATRIEKHGADIEVFLDNHLAFSYTDPQPLAGGYFCAWTRHNGILIGRVNYSAQQMTLGDPL